MCSTSGNRLVLRSTQQWGPACETMTIRLPIHRLHIMGVYDVWDRLPESHNIQYYVLYLCTRI